MKGHGGGEYRDLDVRASRIIKYAAAWGCLMQMKQRRIK